MGHPVCPYLPAYSATAAATKMMQPSSQIEMEVRPCTVGDTVLIVLNMLVRTRNKVTNNPILPGTTEGEIRKLTQDTCRVKSIIVCDREAIKRIYGEWGSEPKF